MTPDIPESPPATLRRLFARFWPELRRHRRAMALALALVAVSPAAEAATIWVYKLAVDDVLVPRDLHALVPIGALFAGLTLVSTMASFADDYASAWVGERFLLDLRTRVFRHLQALSLDFFDRRSLGDLIARLTGDVAAIETLMGSGMTDALAYVLRIVFFSAALVILQPVLAVAALAIAPLYWVTSRRFSRRIKHASREKRRRSGAVSAVAEESLANVALTQAYTREATEAERLDREGRRVFDAEMRTTRLRALFSGTVDLIEMAGVLVVFGVGTYELRAGHLTLGGLTAFLAYLTQLYGPVRRLSRLANTVFSASAGAERILELLDERPRVADRPNATALERVRGAVVFEGVSFAYPGAARGALHDVSFALEPGQTLALVGASGAGKSTAAKLLLRFYDPASGAVRLDGHDLRDVRLADLRRHVALLLQETLILDGSVRENIAYGRPDATEAQIVRAAAAAGAHEFIERLDAGYDERVGQRGRRLSGGQRQRIAIARAMIRDAPVLLLDEPTTGLDAETGRRILEPLRRLMQGRTTLVISHNLLTVQDADRIVVLDDGRVAETGAHDELLALDGPYARLWRLHERPRPVVEVAA